jgi:thiamine biosynthesis lipoprotein
MPRPLNSRHRAAALLMAATVLIGSCGSQKEHQAEFFIFGTVLEVITWGASDRQAEDAFAELANSFNEMHRDWHAWEPGVLVDINRAFSQGQPAAANDDIIELITRSQEIEKKTGGRFNPAIGALIELWGFHTSDFPIIGPPPSPEAIQAILGHNPSSLDISINDNQVQTDNPTVQLDFGGVAKGYAIDVACKKLREHGIANAIVNAGGDLRAFGEHGTRPWRLGIRNPAGGVIGGVESVGDEAIFTSGVYERFRLDNQRRYPHILNPKTGWPVENILAITVISGEGLLADAAATALMVAGHPDWLSVAQSLGLDKVMLIDESGAVYVTPEMKDRVEFMDGVEPVVVNWENTRR